MNVCGPLRVAGVEKDRCLVFQGSPKLRSTGDWTRAQCETLRPALHSDDTRSGECDSGKIISIESQKGGVSSPEKIESQDKHVSPGQKVQLMREDLIGTLSWSTCGENRKTNTCNSTYLCIVIAWLGSTHKTVLLHNIFTYVLLLLLDHQPPQ